MLTTMPKTVLVFYFLITSIAMSFSSHAYGQSFHECDTTLKLSSTTDWYPYIYQEENDTLGVDVTLLRDILNKMDCQLTVVHFPERRSLFELSQGRFDIALGASQTSERIEQFYFSIPYRNETNRYAYREDDDQIASTQSVEQVIAKQKVIGINLAGWYGDNIEKAKSQYNGFIFSDTVDKRLKMLVFNRVDVVIDDDIVLCSEIKRSSYSNVKINPSIISSASIHYIFNKQTISPKFMKRFNDILSSMKNSGELDALYATQISPECLAPAN